MFSKKKITKKNNTNLLIKTIKIIAVFLGVLILTYGVYAINNTEKNTSILEKLNSFNKINDITDNNVNSIVEKEINLETKDKINILLVGRGGQVNDAPNLTDSIILVSINNKYKTISMFSIPRDLYVKFKNGREGKINQIYAIEKFKTKNETKSINSLIYNIEQITAQNIDYYVNIDFIGFTKFIDAIGGITVTVPRTLVDNKYPTANWGYRRLIIKKGTWNFDGKTALMYARSRHSTSDFDRSLRQQQIISATRNKLTSGGFFSKIYKIKQLYDVFKKYTKTDIDLNAVVKIFSGFSDKYKIISFNLNDSCTAGYCEKGGFLYVPPREGFGGLSVLLVDGTDSKDLNNYSKLETYNDLIFNNPDVFLENPRIKVYNSTKTSGIAYTVANKLRKYGLNIPKKNYVGNIKDKNFFKSVIYYNSSEKDSKTLKFLKNKLDIETVEVNYPEYSMNTKVKLEIVLGEDFKKIISNLNTNLD